MFRVIRQIVIRLCQLLVLAVLCIAVVGLIVLFCSCPVDLIVATIELYRADAVTVGVVDDSYTEDAGEGVKPVIHYSFELGGRTYHSSRVFPGFFGNIGGWSTGEEFASQYRIGAPVQVYYSKKAPQRCFLVRGWFKWSLAVTCFFLPILWCLCLLAIGWGDFQPGRFTRAVVGWLGLIGLASVALSDGALYVDKITVYVAVAVVLAVIATVIEVFDLFPEEKEPQSPRKYLRSRLLVETGECL